MVFLTPFSKEIWDHLAQISNRPTELFTESILKFFGANESYDFSASHELSKPPIPELSFSPLIYLLLDDIWEIRENHLEKPYTNPKTILHLSFLSIRNKIQLAGKPILP